MSKEGEKAAVFRTTKVRTKLKGDGSWLQNRSETEGDTKEELKPWVAEVRAGRVNGAPIETSPVSSPTKPTPPPKKPDTERTPKAGFMIRGVFNQVDKPVSSSTSNGVSGTSHFIKKPSESYKKLAPYSVKPTSENQEGQLSHEEQEKRTEAASNVLRKSAARQRSYVLSAAKKYESKEEAPDTSSAKSPSFVAKRVEITEEDESAVTPAAPASTPPPSAVVPVTSVASPPEPKPRRIADTSVKTAADVAVNKPAAPKVEEAAPAPVKEDPPLVWSEKDPFEGMKPGCTKVATPLPELIPERVKAVFVKPEPEEDASGQADTPLVDLDPEPPAPKWPTPVSRGPASTVPSSSGVDTLSSLSDTLISFDTSSTSFKGDEPALAGVEGGSADSHGEEDGSEPEPDEYGDCTPMTDDLLSLSDGPDESADSVPPSPGRWSQDLLGGLDSEPAKPGGALDLLAHDDFVINAKTHSLSTQPEEGKQTDETARGAQSSTETVTTTTKTVIITDKSDEDNAGPWSSRATTTVTKSSSADPFDPYPIGTTSPNSSSDLLQPLADISINSATRTFTENKDPSTETNMSPNALESLADDVIPIDTDRTSLSTRRSWTRTWETSSPQQTNTEESMSPNALESLADDVIPIDTNRTSLSTRRSWARTWDTNTEESQEGEPRGQDEDQKTLVMFERKSSENDSPWDRWTSPTLYTITTTSREEEEEEEEEEGESPEDTQTQTVTTVTTIRETHSEPEPAMDRYETYSRTVTEEDQRVETPEPEKKSFVYVKEYVNASEMSLHNARDTVPDGSDYLRSSSTTYSYSSPSSYSSGPLSSTCTYCGELVGNDAKISIEHLNINCHPACFKCGVCGEPMGDLLFSMYIHVGKVHCENCYSKALD